MAPIIFPLIAEAAILLAPFAAEMARDAPRAEPPKVVKLTLHPAAAPVPALKYRLLPERHELVPGNAALFYHRAIEMVLTSRLSAAFNQQDQKPPRPTSDDVRASEWINGPLEAVPLDEAHKLLDRNKSPLNEVEMGARRTTCDWGLEERSDNTVTLLIGEIQESRALARLIDLRARVAIRERHFDEAVHWIQTGLALGHHVGGDGPFLIAGLVGIAESSVECRTIEALVQQPGAPNLYWALANRPRPFIDLTRALESERSMVERTVPRLRELDGPPWSVAQAREFTTELQTRLFPIAAEGMVMVGPASSPSGNLKNLGMKAWSFKIGIAAMVAQVYPEAKKSLIAQGRSPDEVEAMPTVQVAALYTYQAYQAYRDDLYKWMGVPYHQAHPGLNLAEGGTRGRHPVLFSLISLLSPAVNAALRAQARLDRQFNALQCIEALRLYAAEHHKFPERLDDLKGSPAPLDPIFGRPFEYRLEGDTAHLSAPQPPGMELVPQYAIHYALELAR